MQWQNVPQETEVKPRKSHKSEWTDEPFVSPKRHVVVKWTFMWLLAQCTLTFALCQVWTLFYESMEMFSFWTQLFPLLFDLEHYRPFGNLNRTYCNAKILAFWICERRFTAGTCSEFLGLNFGATVPILTALKDFYAFSIW